MTHQDSTSPVLPRRSGRKVKPNRDPDYEYVQMRIDQLDRELAASGLSPRAPLITSHAHGSHDSPSSRQLSDPPVAVPSTSALTAEIELAQLQRDKLALELEVLKLRAAAAETKVEGVESKPSTTRKKRTIDWPHEFCSGAPTLEFEKLEMADFVAGFLAMVKPYEAKRKEVMLQLLELLMRKASSYTWRSVRGFYAHIAKQVELCRLEFDDESQIRDSATIFFKHSDLRSSTPQPRSNNSAGGGSSSGSDIINNKSSKPDSSQAKACRQWNYLGSCPCDSTSASYAGHHKCRVCAKDHPMLHCPKRRAPIPEVNFNSSEPA